LVIDLFKAPLPLIANSKHILRVGEPVEGLGRDAIVLGPYVSNKFVPEGSVFVPEGSVSRFHSLRLTAKI
jgi:hypothetical protein